MKNLIKISSLSRVFSLALILSLLFLFWAPNSFDTIFLLYIECASLAIMLALLSFFSRSFLDIIMKVLVSAFLIPFIFFLLGCGLILCLLIFSGGGPDAAAELPYPLLQHSWLLMDDPMLALKNIVQYFGSDLYWIVGGFLLYHIAFDFIEQKLKSKSGKNVDGDLWWKIQKQSMLQALALLLGSLILCIPIGILITAEDDHTSLTYGLVIALRLLIEVFKIYLDGKQTENGHAAQN
jgi:hypothetical protein